MSVFDPKRTYADVQGHPLQAGELSRYDKRSSSRGAAMKRGQFIVVLGGAVVSLDAFALSAAVSPATAQSQQQIDWCINTTREFPPDQQVSGCTVAIQSGRWSGKDLVWAFQDRARAYYDKRDYDHAIADYDQAIKLDPKNAHAFTRRGLAHYRKQDY